MARLCGESSCSYSGRSVPKAVARLAAARHSERDVVTVQKSAEVIVVVAVETEATKDRTSRNREELWQLDSDDEPAWGSHESA